MTKHKQLAAPVVEHLLDTAHANLLALRERREAMQLSGMDSNHLPDDVALMAFVLLGDHERGTIFAQLRRHWLDLQEKGFAYGAIDKAPTAELRLLAHVREQTKTIGSITQQLKNADDLSAPPAELWRCPSDVYGLWGQVAHLHFSVTGGIRNLLIDPDPVFGLHPKLLATDPDTSVGGTFKLPVDRGTVRITLLHRSGRIFRHLVHVDRSWHEHA